MWDENETPRSNDEPTFARPAPPSPEAEVMKVLGRWKGKRPKMFPSSGRQAAMYWMGLMEPQNFVNEKAEWESRPSTKERNAGRWISPYTDRLRMSLQSFLLFEAVEQAFVVHHVERGVPYRGDSMVFYREVVKNTGTMLESVEKHGRTSNNLLPHSYTREVLKITRIVTKRMTNLPYDKNERES
jgi:hypothetical protein